MQAKTAKKFNFARSYQELQKLVEWFEKDGFDLEEGIGKFEEGIALVKELKEYLGTMENKVKELKRNGA
ncbi:MAG TPA: exodeoxyribonuclease VII small subunit [Patescibacteria group bacterium]|nr:exodeoxyribonuclease VII small subunit [Patescibacteria group bacterium]